MGPGWPDLTMRTGRCIILGWTGWILPLALVGVLLFTGAFSPVRQQPESQARQSTVDRELHASE